MSHNALLFYYHPELGLRGVLIRRGGFRSLPVAQRILSERGHHWLIELIERTDTPFGGVLFDDFNNETIPFDASIWDTMDNDDHLDNGDWFDATPGLFDGPLRADVPARFYLDYDIDEVLELHPSYVEALNICRLEREAARLS